MIGQRYVIVCICNVIFATKWWLVWLRVTLFPTRDASPISACVLCLRFVPAFSGSGTFTILQKLYLPSIVHLTLTRRNSLIINTLFSVRYYQFHLHATYTTYILPHGTSTGEQYHGIGEQKSLLLRLIFLRPYGVKPTAYDKTDCEVAGCDV